MWKHYYKSTDGVIFVVDSTDSGEERVEECKEALSMFIGEDLLRGCTLLVLANKQDLPDAMSIEEISEKLGLESIQDRRWRKYQMCQVFRLHINNNIIPQILKVRALSVERGYMKDWIGCIQFSLSKNNHRLIYFLNFYATCLHHLFCTDALFILLVPMETMVFIII